MGGKALEVKKTLAVIVQQEGSRKAVQLEESPRLFRVYGGRLKEGCRQRVKEKRLRRLVRPLSDGWRAPQQREQGTNRSCVLK